MKKLFVSQPLKDKTMEEVVNTRAKLIFEAKEKLEEEVNVIDNLLIGDIYKDATPLWYLGKSIELLSEADVVIFAPGWQNYRGCRIEHWCCEYYNIPIIESKGEL